MSKQNRLLRQYYNNQRELVETPPLPDWYEGLPRGSADKKSDSWIVNTAAAACVVLFLSTAVMLPHGTNIIDVNIKKYHEEKPISMRMREGFEFIREGYGLRNGGNYE